MIDDQSDVVAYTPDSSVEVTVPAEIKPVEPVEDLDTEIDEVVSKVSNEDEDPISNDGIAYSSTTIDLRGINEEKIPDLITDAEKAWGAAVVDTQSKTTGTWLNTLLRILFNPSREEQREREALGNLSDEERSALLDRIQRNGKTVLKTSTITSNFDSSKTLSGDEAMMAFSCHDKGGAYRIPLYNSGITIDVLVPTGTDMHTLISNCRIVDLELGSTMGTHYFLYNDLMIKRQILTFLRPLIVNSSYADWRKSDQLWSIIKLPDLVSIVAHLAAMCYKDGFEGFTNSCTRPITEDHPKLCGHVETLTADIFKMIVTRASVLSSSAIDFLVEARNGTKKHNASQIADYQSSLGIEGERLTFGKISFVMRIPSLAEHAESGSIFLADVINEIEGDNSESRYEEMGHRYVRTFLPWIASMELKTNDGKVISTAEPKVIARELEKIDDTDPESLMRSAFIKYINKVQLTYVGYPVTACPVCGYKADTPSGMWTFDPFMAFFTIAFLYLTRASLAPTND